METFSPDFLLLLLPLLTCHLHPNPRHSILLLASFILLLLTLPTLLPSKNLSQAPPPPAPIPLPRIRFHNRPKRTPCTVNPLHTLIQNLTAIRRKRAPRKPTFVPMKPLLIHPAHLHRLRRPVPIWAELPPTRDGAVTQHALV